jgi:two-component system chemotaxis response regulator CheB
MGTIVVIGASSGGLKPLRQITAALPVPCSASIFVVLHIGNHPSVLPSLLQYGLAASFAKGGELIEAGHIYVAPPDHHMLLKPGFIRLTQEPKVHYTRPAVDPLFISAAQAYGTRVVGIVLSGGNSDGAAGLRAIREHGGITFVQSPEEALMPYMPRAAITAGHFNDVLPVAEIALRVSTLCSFPLVQPDKALWAR